jgi:hypothetical protein
MIRGSCLCGGVKFEIRGSKGPFELCHCNRCRKATGSGFAAGLRVRGEDLRIVQGQELIKTFEAPIIDAPPPYTNRFCGRCGSPEPVPSDNASWLEVPAGALGCNLGGRYAASVGNHSHACHQSNKAERGAVLENCAVPDLVPQNPGHETRHQLQQPNRRVVPADAARAQRPRYKVGRKGFAHCPKHTLV